MLLKAHDTAFRTGDSNALRSARTALTQEIRKVKKAYVSMTHGYFSDTGDTRRIWQGIQTLTHYKGRQNTDFSDASLPDRLNRFFARFEASNTTPRGRASRLIPSDQLALSIDPEHTRRTLTRVNSRKATGPDNIPGRMLKESANELADVLTDIFNISLSQAIVPRCFKTSTIIPVAKKSVSLSK